MVQDCLLLYIRMGAEGHVHYHSCITLAEREHKSKDGLETTRCLCVIIRTSASVPRAAAAPAPAPAVRRCIVKPNDDDDLRRVHGREEARRSFRRHGVAPCRADLRSWEQG